MPETEPQTKPDFVPVKIRRDVWERFQRWHRIEDGKRAILKQPTVEMRHALSEFVSARLPPELEASATRDTEDTQDTE